MLDKPTDPPTYASIVIALPAQLRLTRGLVNANRFKGRIVSWTVASGTREATFIVIVKLPTWPRVSNQAADGPTQQCKWHPRVGRIDLADCYQ